MRKAQKLEPRERTFEAPEPTSPAFHDWRCSQGFDVTRAAFRKAVVAGSLPPVVLLAGRRGLGKKLLAAELAAIVFCATRDACGECDDCRMALAGAHPEILHLASDGEPIDVERATTAQEHVGLRPSSGAPARVVIIEDIDRLTVSAANRLLKTLEEPPHGARFLMTSSRPGAILATIKSRSVIWRVAPLPYADFAQVLGALAATRGLSLPTNPQSLAYLAKISGFAPGEALRALERGTGHALSGAAESLLKDGRSERLEAAQTVRGASAPALLEAVELELNAFYHARLTSGGPAPLTEARRAKARRAKLMAARAAAAEGRVAISAQLVAESIALS